MKQSKFEIAEYRDWLGSYYVVVEAGRAACIDTATNPNERIRAKAEAKRALKEKEQAVCAG